MYIPAMVDQPGSNWALDFDHRRATQEEFVFPNMTKTSAKYVRPASKDVLRHSKRM
jgi:hypothetical protein